jgi:MFS family permease
MWLPAWIRDARAIACLRNYRNYRLYAGGQFISLMGTWLQFTAIAWVVLQVTHSAVALGAFGAWSTVPYIALGLFGGVISDRFDRRRTLMVTQSVYFALAIALAAVTWNGATSIWPLYTIAMVDSLTMIVDAPTRQAFVSQMVGQADLTSAVALNTAIFNAARIVGPAVAGVLIATVGARACFVLNALSYLLMIAALLTMRPTELFGATRQEQRASPLRDLRDGFSYAWHTASVRMTLTILLVVAAISLNFSLWLPVLAAQTLRMDAQVYGVLSACFGVGGLVGALLAALRGRATWPLLLASVGGFGLALLLLAPLRALPPVLVALVLVGAVSTVYMVTSNALTQLASPPRLQGRVMGFYSYIFFGTTVPGALLAGWLAQTGGTTLAFIVAGAVNLLMCGVGLAWFLGARPHAAVALLVEEQVDERVIL